MEKKYQIFISSTYEDLKEERKKVQDTILSMYQFPIGMEMFSAADEDQWEIIRETIDSSDYYVLIIGHRYGSVITEGEYAGISYTQKEFCYALEQEIPVLAFLIDDKVPITPDKMEQDADKRKTLNAFKDEVKTGRMVQWWSSADDLANKVMNSLNKQIARKNRPGWIRADGSEKPDKSPIVDVQRIMNELQSDNIVEFDLFIKYVQNVWDYRIKFKNKFISYIENSRIYEEEYRAKKGISEREFYSNYSEALEYEWFYIGLAMETLCTKLGIDYSLISAEEKLRYDCESETAYMDYLIQDAWHELEKIEDDKKFVYGVYVLCKILQGKRQNILKEEFYKLIIELINKNFYIENRLYDNVNRGEAGESSNINASISANQNIREDLNELMVILKEIMKNLSTLKKEDAEKIMDVVKIVKVEFISPGLEASNLRNCLTLITPMFSIANGNPLLVENLKKLQDYIIQYI